MRNNQRILGLFCCLGLLVIGPGFNCAARAARRAQHAQRAQRSEPVHYLQPWPGQRVILLLPLHLGEGWNVDRQYGQALLPSADHDLEAVLEKTGKFSVVRPYRFNPILLRAVRERRITQEEMQALIDTPSIETGRAVMNKLTFNQPPLVADFALEEVRASGTRRNVGVQQQISYHYFDPIAPDSLKIDVITSDTVKTGPTTLDRIVLAADNAFHIAAAAMTRGPEDIQLIPEPAPPTVTRPVTPAPATPVPATPAPGIQPEPAPNPEQTPNSTTLPGDVGMAGAASRIPEGTVPSLPPPQPPLGIDVPKSANG